MQTTFWKSHDKRARVQHCTEVYRDKYKIEYILKSSDNFLTGLSTKYETVKTTFNSSNMTIPGLNYVFCFTRNLSKTYLTNLGRKKQV